MGTGEPISTADPEYHKIADTIMETMQLAHKLNQFPELICQENRDLFAEIFGRKLAPSTTILPPFHADYGRKARRKE